MKTQGFSPRCLSHEDTRKASFHGLAETTRDTGNPPEPVFLLDRPTRPLQIFSPIKPNLTPPANPLGTFRGFGYTLLIEIFGGFGVLIGAGVFVLLVKMLMGRFHL